MENRTKYTAWLNWSLTMKCNFRCSYCNVRELRDKGKLYPIDVDVIVKNLNDTGEIFNIAFSGGEPFIVPNILELFTTISEKHYIGLNTNLSSSKIKDFAKYVNPEKVDFINASLHIDEIEKHKLFDRYISNFLLLREKGIYIFCTVVGYPGFADRIEKYYNELQQYDIDLVGNPFWGTYKNKKYPKSYTDEELKIFYITEQNNEGIKRFYKKNMPCNAGYNVGCIRDDGDITPCYQIVTPIGNIFKGFKFHDSLMKCPAEFCTCPLNVFVDGLFKKSLKETTKFHSNFKPTFKDFNNVTYYELI